MVEAPQSRSRQVIAPIHRHAAQRYAREHRERGHSRGAFDTELRERGHTARSELVQWGAADAPPITAAALRLAEGEQVAIRKRHMFADDTPIQIATSYVPWSLAQGTPIAEHDTGAGGTYSRLADIGHPVARFTEELHTRTPTPDEAELLQLDDDQQVYSILHTAWDTHNQPVEICIHIMPTAQWILHYQWNAEE